MEKTTTTDAKMVPLELVDQEADTDLVREMLAFAAERMMDMKIEAKTGAAAGRRSADRLTTATAIVTATGTRAGRIELAIPKLRKVSYSGSTGRVTQLLGLAERRLGITRSGAFDRRPRAAVRETDAVWRQR